MIVLTDTSLRDFTWSKMSDPERRELLLTVLATLNNRMVDICIAKGFTNGVRFRQFCTFYIGAELYYLIEGAPIYRYIKIEIDHTIHLLDSRLLFDDEKYTREVFESSAAKIVCCIKKVIFHKPATIVIWEDGTKTVVKCNKDDSWDPEKGLAMAIIKKSIGLKQFNKFMKGAEILS